MQNHFTDRGKLEASSVGSGPGGRNHLADETAVEIRGKTLEYLHAGSALVWNIYPRSREVVAFTPDGVSRTFGEHDILQDEKVLPGFRCAVAELFR